MQSIEKSYPYTLQGFMPSVGLIDCETTGLIATRDTLLSLGLVYKAPSGHLIYRHLVADKPGEEKELLLAFLEVIKPLNTFYSYNGNSFDWPFIRARLTHHGLEEQFPLSARFLDLKKLLKKISPTRQGLEDLLGFKRQGTLTGKDLAKLCKAYEQTGGAPYFQLILSHQEEELFSLGHFYNLYQLLTHLQEGTIVRATRETLSLTAKGALIGDPSTGKCLTLILMLSEALFTSLHLQFPYFTLEGEKDQKEFTIHYTCQDLLLRHYLSPAKNYYFIPSQNQLLHKSLAQFLPSEMRQKVKKEDCYLTKTSTFLPLATTHRLTLPLWQDEKGQPYVEYVEEANLYPLLIAQVLHTLLT